MSKLLAILLAGVFATGAAVAQTTPSTGKDTGSPAGSNTPSGTGAASGTMDNSTHSKSTTTDENATGAMGASGELGACPPGLDQKNNNCLPPRQVRKSTRSSMTKDKALHSDKAQGENAQDKTDKTAR